MRDNCSTPVNLYIQPTYITVIPDRIEHSNRSSEYLKSIVTCQHCSEPQFDLFSIYDYEKETYQSVCKECQTKYHLAHNLHVGLMSQKAKTRMRNAVNWLAAAATRKRVWQKSTNKSFYFKLSFITLTLPQHDTELSDQEFKSRVLHPFLIYAAKSWSLYNYVWKAEPQDNGNIHIHITTDIFIHHQKLRKAWNRQLSNLGLLDKFELKHGHRSPPSTEIKAVRSVKNLAGYISEYLVKDKKFKSTCSIYNCTDSTAQDKSNSDWYQDKKGTWWELKRAITGNIWYSSSNLSATNKLMYVADSADSSFWSTLTDNDALNYIDQKYYQVYYFSPKEWSRSITGKLRHLFNDHLAGIRHNWQKSPPLFHIID
ncbi:MAG TPA: hypothetical protein ENH49_06365 [Candidatus Marinimicrobia bacterium]|nr:hypothetical protein [Candidatus Neomarinimicrobiota bacterium]